MMSTLLKMQVTTKQSQHRRKLQMSHRTSPLILIKLHSFIPMLHPTSTISLINCKINSFSMKTFRFKIKSICLLILKYKLLIINKFIIFSIINKIKNQCIYLRFQDNQFKISAKSIIMLNQ